MIAKILKKLLEGFEIYVDEKCDKCIDGREGIPINPSGATKEEVNGFIKNLNPEDFPICSFCNGTGYICGQKRIRI